MKSVLIITSVLFLLACSNTQSIDKAENLWSFTAQNHQVSLDQLSKPLIHNYEKLLVGFYQEDTFSIQQISADFLIQMDTAMAHLNAQDSLHLKCMAAIQAMQSELEALQLETTLKEKQQSLSMFSVLMLNYLGLIGYQQNTIYIFSSVPEASEELYWFGFTKTAQNPYNVNDATRYTANQVLQENP